MQTISDAEMRRRVIVSSTIGNALEWFDFTVYGLFATVVAAQYFPGADSSSGLLKAFATFGIAFAARPLGGLAFGLYADKHGRKRALVVMIAMMAIGTGLIGFVPNHAAIGVVAPILLVVARLIQGFSAGGEFGSASAMLIEFAPPGRRGFYGAFQMVSQLSAGVLGVVIALALKAMLTPEDFARWGWRVPFVLGILIGPIGYYLRAKVDESPEFQAYLAARAAATTPRRRTTLGELFANHPRELIASFCLIAVGTAANYVGTVFMPNFAAAELKLPIGAAYTGLLVVNLVNAVLVLVFGALSDRVGRKTLIVPALVVYCALYYVLMRQLVAEPTVAHLWQLQASGLLLAVLAGPLPAFMTEIFPVGVRSTGASLMYNLAVMLFGGLAPFFSEGLVKLTGDRAAPVYYIFFAAAVGVAGLALYRERRPQAASPSGA